MNNKDIKFTGYTAVPSDYECPDGQLAQSLNLLNETGSMQPIFPPKVLLSLDAGSNIVFVHKTSAYIHYIIKTADNYLKWISSLGDEFKYLPDSHHENISHINAVGNTLMVFTDTSITYYLMKDGDYKLLGNNLPDINVSFGLVGHPRRSDFFSVSLEESIEDDIEDYDQPEIELSDANKDAVTNQVMAKLNKLIKEQTIDKGRFCFPFFIRYALRLYDGSLVHHSAPILMNPSTGPAPIVCFETLSNRKELTQTSVFLIAADIDYKVLHDNNYSSLDNWSDIIKSIDVFISKPLYSYDQSGKISHIFTPDLFANTKFIGKLFHNNENSNPSLISFADSVTEDRIVGPVDGDLDFLKHYMEWPYNYVARMYYTEKNSDTSTRTFAAEQRGCRLPAFSDEKNNDTIVNCAAFYKLHSISLDDAKAETRKTIPIADDYLQSLLARELMTDDYLSHDAIAAAFSYNYNSRLNLAGIKRKLFTGSPPPAMFAYCDRELTDLNVSNGAFDIKTNSLTDPVKITIYIKENGKTYSVSSQSDPDDDIPAMAPWGSTARQFTFSTRSWGAYLFYPNTNAFKVVIESVAGGGVLGNTKPGLMAYDLAPHDFLNGAYCFLNYNIKRRTNISYSQLPSNIEPSGTMIENDNKIYTSEVNNPFLFPATGINTVGNGRILGICSAAKALSQGQFGQFPLYAFTDEGVWALEVSSSGGFSAKQPITRDVCRSADSITQIDSAVLFATDRGIILISGSQTQCISDVLNAPDYFDFHSLPALCDKFPELCFPDCRFIDYIKNCRMAYDYVNQRIIVFNPDKSYAYVYSMKTKLWGIQECSLSSVINSYPDAFAMAEGEEENYLVDLSHTDAEEVRCLLVSRPLKFDSPDVMKTISTSIQRGILPRRREDIATLLYGTRDYLNWHLIGSSTGLSLRAFRGTPYKAFRIVSVATLRKGKTIAGCSFNVIPRMTNRLR